MQRSSRSKFLLVVTGLVAVGTLAGCASDGQPAATETVTAPAPSPSASASTPQSSEESASAAPSSGSGATGSSAGDRCAASSLAGRIEAGSGGAAGSVIVHLVLENTGSTTCTVQGWPGVSFVGGGTGKQIGAAAVAEKSSPHPTVTLAPGKTAVAPLKIVRAENYPAGDCSPQTPDGFRVYPPGSKQSLFVKDTDYQACASADASLLSVQAFVPEGQATS
ncbi:DUF4232 domain-containing protein [Curtobacterium flaccumfaciens]|uniref:DUF4232 domain-containing protein n=1 Tax=Curtobacterium poinsettiae TaxID=159612 RepID=A0A9Q9P9X1_9MICO|nr:DUF4232 domain-containing protein [Curtobacterium flaccumfaciens]MCS6561359.1 DUF4232 domain-containing protein [Curtobacterium flaccumfaciens pv. poinsettiae]UXN26656.1 DUF4232 domain-containing protein [Curtobacterium flaccumfaciens]UXN29297.1 DUF4232 domain-containing protein [Curtobacterium flaccumfaciens]UYC81498.1 DUF4232 domain-containing protein [Curtobacterium flaccumfaciens pv. poinsettiae]